MVGEISIGEISVGDAFVGEMSVGMLSVGNVSNRGSVRPRRVLSGNCPLGKCPDHLAYYHMTSGLHSTHLELVSSHAPKITKNSKNSDTRRFLSGFNIKLMFFLKRNMVQNPSVLNGIYASLKINWNIQSKMRRIFEIKNLLCCRLVRFITL